MTRIKGHLSYYIHRQVVKRYRQSKLRLLETVQQLRDPWATSNMTLFRGAVDRIKVMALVNQHIDSAAKEDEILARQVG